MKIENLVEKIYTKKCNIIEVEREMMMEGNTDKSGNYGIIRLTFFDADTVEVIEFSNSNGVWEHRVS